VELKIGLDGIAVAETTIASVNGQKGRLIYRGNRIEDVVAQHNYESVVFLILEGRFPKEDEKKTFSDRLKSERDLPDSVKVILRSLPHDTPVMQAIRTAVSALSFGQTPWPPTQAQALAIFAKMPTIIAFFHHVSHGQEPIEPDKSLGHAANYLYMLHGKKPTQAHVEALETYLSVSIEHGMNASTFTARVVSATEENIVGAITAAMAALEGPLHGGAPSKVDDMLDAIGSADAAESWLREKIESGARLMGFGHRVYKTYDPRAAILKGVTEKLATDDNPLFQLAMHVESTAIRLLAEYKPGRNLYPNLEFWTAGVLRTVNLPRTLYTPTFCLSRVAGWSAHILEQSEHNRLIRPGSIYTGVDPYEAD
jgi:citrate synthase